MVYLITGKKGAGKTTYAYRLAEEMENSGDRVVVIDGDEFRRLCNNHDFSDKGRLKNLMDAAKYTAVLEADGNIVICAFVSPRRKWRKMMRAWWRESQLVYIPGGELWPGTDYEVPLFDEMQPHFNQDKKYSLFIGRYQPFHEGHEALIRKVLDEGKNVCIALRETKQSKTNPYDSLERRWFIFERFHQEILDGRVIIIKIPDIEEVCYGRRVGWDLREIKLDKKTEQISATKIRSERK